MARRVGQDGTTVDQLIVRDASGADFILARPIQHCSRAFLDSLQLDRLTMTLRNRYDLVVIDTPPLLSVVDPLLSRFADATILVLPWRAITGASRGRRSSGCSGSPVARRRRHRARGGVHERYAYAGYSAEEA